MRDGSSQGLRKNDRSGKRPFKRWVFGFIVVLTVLITSLCIVTIEVAAHVGGSSVDCLGRLPFVKPLFSEQAVFTARVLYVGRVDPKYAFRSGHRFGGPWAIADVHHRYWGLPWWSSKIVVLSPGWFQEGEVYFVDGDRGALRSSRFLPIVYVGTCTRTRPLNEAALDLRILKDGPPKDGVRIINRAYQDTASGGEEPFPGLRVQINGPGGSFFTTTDANGVYDVTGLPPGHYTVQIEHPNLRDEYEAFVYEQKSNLKLGDVWGRPVHSQ